MQVEKLLYFWITVQFIELKSSRAINFQKDLGCI